MSTSSPPKIYRKQGERYRNPGAGRLVTWSTIAVPPPAYTEYAPYIVAVVELEDSNERITTQLVDVDAHTLEFGQRVTPVFRRYFADGDDGVIGYGYKFTTP